MINNFAQDFEDKVSYKLFTMPDDEKKLEFLLNLQDWVNEY